MSFAFLRQKLELKVLKAERCARCVYSLTSAFLLFTFLNPFRCRIPNELMQLQSQACGNIVGEDPLRQFSGIEQTMRSIAAAAGILIERRRKQYGVHRPSKIVPGTKSRANS